MNLRNFRPPIFNSLSTFLFWQGPWVLPEIARECRLTVSPWNNVMFDIRQCGNWGVLFDSLLKALGIHVAEESFDESLGGKKEEMRSIKQNACQDMCSVSLMGAIVDQILHWLDGLYDFFSFFAGVVEGAVNLLVVKIFFHRWSLAPIRGPKSLQRTTWHNDFRRRVLVNKGREQKPQNQDAHESSGNEIFHGYNWPLNQKSPALEWLFRLASFPSASQSYFFGESNSQRHLANGHT